MHDLATHVGISKLAILKQVVIGDTLVRCCSCDVGLWLGRRFKVRLANAHIVIVDVVVGVSYRAIGLHQLLVDS